MSNVFFYFYFKEQKTIFENDYQISPNFYQTSPNFSMNN